MSILQKIITRTCTASVALGLIIGGLSNPVYAGWGIKDLDPFNKNSGIRQTGREIDQQRLDATGHQFYLHNQCPENLSVTLEYIPRNSSKWKTSYYSFKPGEHAYLIPTRNRIVYVSAKSTDTYSNKKWSRKEINMGNNIKYTHRLTCR
ncbi:hypothetical protein IQ255_15755 [Pleurocapsales cyanobacterium LEGE 10410]|nr:hypothetical protein [Pleurocapsales cyanobacterium LEGE 10410]